MANYPAYRQFKGSSAEKAGDLPPTPPDILGPYWKDGAPELADGNLCDDPKLYLSGVVQDAHGNPVEAVLDFWQADPDGSYDEAGYKFRGKVRTVLEDRGAWYELNTVRPGDYKISNEGEPDEFRCAHVHVIVTAQGFKPLTTQLYFADDPNNRTDHWFSSRRVISESPGRRPGTFEGRFDFVLEAA